MSGYICTKQIKKLIKIINFLLVQSKPNLTATILETDDRQGIDRKYFTDGFCFF